MIVRLVISVLTVILWTSTASAQDQSRSGTYAERSGQNWLSHYYGKTLISLGDVVTIRIEDSDKRITSDANPALTELWRIFERSTIRDYYSMAVAVGIPPIFDIEYADGLHIRGSRYAATFYLKDGRSGSVVLMPNDDDALIGNEPFRARMNLPAIRETYSQMYPGIFKGKTIRSIIQPEKVQLIALLENRGKGSPLTTDFTPDWDSNQLVRRAFISDAEAQELSMTATESILARYAIVTKDGALFALDVLGNSIGRVPITAILLRGDGFGCRFDINTGVDSQPSERR